MQIHNFDSGTSHRITREPTKAVTLQIDRAAFDAIHKGQILREPPKNYAPCRLGFRFYQDASGQVMGIKD